MKNPIQPNAIRRILDTPAAYSIGATLALQGFSLLGFMLLARLLPLGQMGLWAIWLTLMAIADAARQGLVQNGLVRYSASDAEAAPGWNSAALLLNTGAALSLGLMLGTGFMLSVFFSNQGELWPLGLWALPILLTQGFGRLAEAIQTARSDFKGIFWANLLNGTVQLSLIFFLLVNNIAPTLVQLAQVQLGGMVSGLLFTIFFRKSYFRFGLLEKQKIVALFDFGKYGAGTNFFSLLFQRLDTLLISAFLTPSAVAIYNVATRLNGLLDLPLNGMSQALYPRMAAEVNGDVPLQEIYGKAVRKLLALHLALTLTVVVLSPLLVRLMAGEAYMDAVPLLRLLAVAGLVKPWGRTFGLLLDASGNSALNFKLLLLSFGVNLAFGLTFLPIFGLMGAAVATGVGVAVTTAIGQYFLQKRLSVQPWSLHIRATG